MPITKPIFFYIKPKSILIYINESSKNRINKLRLCIYKCGTFFHDIIFSLLFFLLLFVRPNFSQIIFPPFVHSWRKEMGSRFVANLLLGSPYHQVIDYYIY